MADDSFSPAIISRKDAIAAGLRLFFTGKPCRRGHVAPRPVNSSDCTVCRDNRVKAWNEANADRRKEIREQWRIDNREKDLQTKRDYFYRNRDKLAVKGKAYYHANKAQHQASVRAWKDAHPAECIVSAHTSRARKSGWTGPVMTLDQYKRLVVEQDGRCAYCRKKAKLLFDHVRPIVYGGSFAVTNCILACRECNLAKSYHPLPFFLEKLAKRHPELDIASVDEIETKLAEEWRK